MQDRQDLDQKAWVFLKKHCDEKNQQPKSKAWKITKLAQSGKT